MRRQLILAGAAAAAFAAGIGGSFHLDDYALLSDPAVQAPGGWLQVFSPERARPLTDLTFWLNAQTGGWHLNTLLLHIAAVLLLFGALRKVLGERAALLAACLFAVHPIQSEAVLYVSARGIVVATVLCLLSLNAWLAGRRWRAVLWFGLALLAHGDAAAFPLLLVFLTLGLGLRDTAADTGKGQPRVVEALRSIRRDLAPIGTMLALSVAAGAHTLWLASRGAGAAARIGPLEYFASQGLVVLRYLRLLVFPWGFTVDPDLRTAGMWWWIAVAGVAVVAWRQGRAGWWFLAGLVLLLPSSSFLPAADLAADHRMYLPMIAFAAAVGLALEPLKPVHLAPLGMILVALSVGRCFVWRSELALWEEAARRAPLNVRPKVQLARVVEPERALPLLLEAQARDQDNPTVAAGLGRLYLRIGRPDAALEEFGRALALDPCLFEVRLELKRMGAPAPPAPGCRFTPEQARKLEAQR